MFESVSVIGFIGCEIPLCIKHEFRNACCWLDALTSLISCQARRHLAIGLHFGSVEKLAKHGKYAQAHTRSTPARLTMPTKGAAGKYMHIYMQEREMNVLLLCVALLSIHALANYQQGVACNLR